jgi:hypothetical protein
MGTIHSSDRIAATLYSLETKFVSGIYVLIPCIKEIVMVMMIIIIIIIIKCRQSTANSGVRCVPNVIAARKRLYLMLKFYNTKTEISRQYNWP